MNFETTIESHLGEIKLWEMPCKSRFLMTNSSSR